MDATLSAEIDKFLVGENLNAAEAAVVQMAMNPEAPYDLVTSGSVTLDVSNGLFQRITMDGDIEMGPPVGGEEGMTLRLWIIGSGSLNFSGILLPSDSSMSWPKDLGAGNLYIVHLQYQATPPYVPQWMLTSLVGGYALNV